MIKDDHLCLPVTCNACKSVAVKAFTMFFRLSVGEAKTIS